MCILVTCHERVYNQPLISASRGLDLLLLLDPASMALLCLIVLACDALNSSEARGKVGKPAVVPVKYEDENAGDGPLRTEFGECVALVSEALDTAFLRSLDDLASLPFFE